MKHIQLPSQPDNQNWGMRFVDESDYDQLFNEDVSIKKPNGEPLLVLRKGILSERSVTSAWSILKKTNLESKNRGLASGIRTKGRKSRETGKKSKFNQVPFGWEVYSGIVGYFERKVRRPYCRPCSWNQNNPERLLPLYPIIKEVSSVFEREVPKRFSVQKEYVDKTHPAYVIPGSVYTTLTINKNFRTACHKDAGDLEAGFSNMAVIRQGLYKGGNLVLPNWRIAVNLDSRDVVMFDAHEWHGNTQIVPLSKDAVRCSIVFYYREKMCLCKSPEEELQQAKNRKEGDPLW